ncbi:MAG TPA: DUF456 domain-containing protein [Tepidisphaeraceae bacterium]|jgi:hypothetical protein|nr:DUF456 domain-containing protein [Tepidisphaeraceae bacterium]
MIWLYYILLLLLAAAGIILLICTLPGLWLITGSAAIYALITHERHLGFKTLITLLILSLAGEAFELLAGSAAARKSGGGRRGMIGGIVGGLLGGIVGSFFFPIVLSIVGICIGSFVGASGFELLGGKHPLQSVSIGWGAAKGRFQGMILKLAIGLVMALLVLIAAFP